ncbi:MAG: hypothetical protein HYV60_00550 [Planctomycetia bacterium]|nr:hypothetical protein [Planctomycetia bacterium]
MLSAAVHRVKVPMANAAMVGDGFLDDVPLLSIQREFRLGHPLPRGLLAFRVRLEEAARFLHPPPLVARQPRTLRRPHEGQRERIVHWDAAK